MKNGDWQFSQTPQSGLYGPNAVLVANVTANTKRPMIDTNTAIKVRVILREALWTTAAC